MLNKCIQILFSLIFIANLYCDNNEQKKIVMDLFRFCYELILRENKFYLYFSFTNIILNHISVL